MDKNMLIPTIETGAVCIPNINTAERRKRLAGGVIGLVISLAILVALMAFGASRWWRLLLFPVFAGSASGYFQWRDHTWTGLAARGSRHLGEQEEKITDAAELAQVRNQARAVQLKSLLAAIPLTVAALLLP